jgi:hypothetical protein
MLPPVFYTSCNVASGNWCSKGEGVIVSCVGVTEANIIMCDVTAVRVMYRQECHVSKIM